MSRYETAAVPRECHPCAFGRSLGLNAGGREQARFLIGYQGSGYIEDSPMVLALLLSLLGSAPANSGAAVASDDPPIKVWLNQDNYFQRGDRARVHVKPSEDGYLVVLRADAEGRVRVLFPLDPSDDAFVRGGRTLEVRGRGDREAFSIDEREGTGVVLAARSTAPFKFDEFVRGDHWDYRVLDARQAGDDKEAALLDLVQRMVPDGHFDYDAQKYFVGAPRAYYDSYYYPSFTASFGYGWPYHYGYGFGYFNSCFDPFFYDPFSCGGGFYNSFYSPFFYSPFVYGYRPFIYWPFFPRGIVRYRGFGVGGMAFKNPPGTNPTTGIGPRLRIPQGTLLTRTTPAATPVRVRDAALHETQTRASSFPLRERPDRLDRPSPDRGVSAAQPRGERGADRSSDGGSARSVTPEQRDG